MSKIVLLLKERLLKINELYHKKNDGICEETSSSQLNAAHSPKPIGDDEFGYYNNWIL